MAKPSILNRVLQLRAITCLSYALCLLTIIHFFSCSTYNYSPIPIATLDRHLYKEVNHKLLLKKDNPQCSTEDVIYDKHSINSWEVPKIFDDFSPLWLANGSYSPRSCNPQLGVAILVTYRNRQRQLDVFLPYMHNFLRKQNIHYKIFLIEQQDEKPWNKGMLYNIGAKYAIAEKFPCLILHDVDLLPLNSANLYGCLYQPRHMSASIDKFRYMLPYSRLVGGVLAIRADQYVKLNGFSNRFQHWGGEDDDFFERMKKEGLNVLRLPPEVSEYTMLVHKQEPVNPDVRRVLRENRQQSLVSDGLDSVHYDYMHVKHNRLFTQIGVKL